MDVITGLERYLLYHRAEGSSPKTLHWHRYSIGEFAALLAAGGCSPAVEDLSPVDFRDFIVALPGRGLTQSSIATKVRSLKAFGKWLVAEEYVGRGRSWQGSTPGGGGGGRGRRMRS